MTTRLRWYEADLSQAMLRRLQQQMTENQFAPGRESGFRLAQARRDVLEGTFIEKVDIQDAVEDPFGNVLEFKRVEFRRVAFRLSTAYPQLELTDPPRTLKEFIRVLGEYTSYEVALAAPQVSAWAWMGAVEKAVERFAVLSMECSSVALSPSVGARVIVTGAGGDVRRLTKQWIADRPCSVERVRASWRLGTGTGVVDIAENARAAVVEGPVAAARDVLREALRGAAAPAPRASTPER
jgi:hypothetical protein